MAASRLVILISGTGSNMEALMRACDAGALDARVVAVLSNKPDAGGLAIAAERGIATEVVSHRDFTDRETFDAALAERIEAHRPDLVVLAGFMRILTAGFVRRFRGRLMNIHPSLLPKYPGLDTHRRAIEAADSEAGATVHFVTEELDGGPAIVQGRVAVLPDDTTASLANRVLAVEHRLYPCAVQLFCSGRLSMDDRGAVLDGQLLPEGGVDYTQL